VGLSWLCRQNLLYYSARPDPEGPSGATHHGGTHPRLDVWQGPVKVEMLSTLLAVLSWAASA